MITMKLIMVIMMFSLMYIQVAHFPKVLIRGHQCTQVRLLQGEGTQLAKRSTAVFDPNAARHCMTTGDKANDATTRSPCWMGLDNGKSSNLPHTPLRRAHSESEESN